MSFRNLGLAAKLLAGFITVCLFTILVGLVGIKTSSGIQGSLVETTTDSMPSLLNLANAQFSLVRGQRNIAQALLTSDAQATADNITRANSQIAGAEKAWAAYKAMSLSPAEQKLAATFDDTYKQWKPLATQAIAEASKNTEQGDQAAKDISSKADAIAVNLNNTLSELMKLQGDQAKQAADDASASYNTAFRIQLGIIGVALVLGLGVALLLARSITGNVKQMLDASRLIAKGDLSHELTITSHDEIGKMGEAFREMVGYRPWA